MAVAALGTAGLAVDARQQSSSQQQTGDPLADAARKAREQKKNATKPKKIYTDDDVSKAAPAPTSSPENSVGAPAAGAPAPRSAGAASGGAAMGQDDPNSEKAWRKKFQDQRDKIAKAERELDVLQREVEKAQVEYYPDPQKALSEQNTRKDINEKTAKIEAKKKEIGQLKQGLDDLEDQLRKAGGDPGWAR
jgi:DNA repair exonuclease SbcCD ATPase subunit